VSATYEEVAEMARRFPEVVEGERHGSRTWFVNKKGFAWERGFTKADLRRFGEEGISAPEGPVLAVLVADLDDKASVLAAGTKGIFDMAHFKGYPAVLIQLDKIPRRALRRALEDAWLAAAPKRLADLHLHLDR
jgi:hypothetical protein